MPPKGPAPKYLDALNKDQLRAVKHDPSIPCQILSGPGSGKTRVLISRVAHLHLGLGMPADTIVVVTFTRKASKEMTHRLEKLLGPEATGRLQLGTFHSLCGRYLRDHGTLIGLPRHFSILDPDDCKAICKDIITARRSALSAIMYDMKEFTLQGKISSAKSKGKTPEDLAADARKLHGRAQTDANMTVQLYKEYQQVLKKQHAIDFDDMLSLALKLFKKHPEVISNISHVLVDEGQDMNGVQYSICRLLAKAAGGISVVGDPDQAIYGWRDAEVGNIKAMLKDFKGCQTILLEDNYRSTGAILSASHTVVAQDKSRIAKGLRSNHPSGLTPVVISRADAHDQAQWIAQEILRVRNATGLSFDDFAVLLRYNSLSRVIEQAFHAARVPNRLVGTTGFFARKEIKDILAYVSLVDNPFNTTAFERIINVPNRGLGAKTVELLGEVADREGVTALEVASRAVRGVECPGISKALASKLKGFIYILDTLREMIDQGEGPHAVIQKLLFLTAYREFLTRSADDPEGRWENVKELLTFALEEERRIKGETAVVPVPLETPMLAFEDHGHEYELLPLEQTQASAQRLDNGEINRVRVFLESCSLSTDVASGSSKQGAVQVLTYHSAKGLEMPVVFLPTLNDDVLPFFKAKSPSELAEERRLLFVGMTRAQCLLYMSSTKLTTAPRPARATRCRFLTDAIRSDSKSFTLEKVPAITEDVRAAMLKVLGREMVSLQAALSQSQSSGSLTEISPSNSIAGPSATPRASTSSGSVAPPYATPSALKASSSSQGKITSSMTKEDRLKLAAESRAKHMASRQQPTPPTSTPNVLAAAPPQSKPKEEMDKIIPLDSSDNEKDVAGKGKGKAKEPAAEKVIALDTDEEGADAQTPIAQSEKAKAASKKPAMRKRAAEEDALIVLDDIKGVVKGGKTLRSSKRNKA